MELSLHICFTRTLCVTSLSIKSPQKTDISLYEVHKFEQNFFFKTKRTCQFRLRERLMLFHSADTTIEYFVRICDGGGKNGKWKEERFSRERARVPARSAGRVQIPVSQSRDELRDQGNKALGLPA